MVEHKRIRVLVETAERSFKGYVHKPVRGDNFRLSDFLNSYERHFICLTEVEIADRGQHYRVGERLPFIAVSIASVTYMAPLEDDMT